MVNNIWIWVRVCEDHNNFIITTLIGLNSIKCVEKKLRGKNAIKFLVIYDFKHMKMIFLCLFLWTTHSEQYFAICFKCQHFSFTVFLFRSRSRSLCSCGDKTMEMCECHKCLWKLHNTIYVQINWRVRVKTYKYNICHIFFPVCLFCTHVTHVLNFLGNVVPVSLAMLKI